jgi:dihydrofolate reductase
MRKLIATTFISVDGYMVGPNEDISWVTATFNEEMGQYAGGLQSTMVGILLGRVSYQILGGFWPTAGDTPGAKEMNAAPKYVVSRTLDKVEWGAFDNASLIKDNLAEEINKLKAEPGGDIVIYGSGMLIHSLTELGLIDEFQLLVHPIIVGGGKLFFTALDKLVKLNLLQTKTFKNGVVVLYYAPERK